MGAAQRRRDIDWLRVLAVLLLLPFHTGRVYNAGEAFYVKAPEVSDGVGTGRRRPRRFPSPPDGPGEGAPQSREMASSSSWVSAANCAVPGKTST